MKSFSRAYSPSCGSGAIRSSSDDFFVDEILGFPADEEGNHVLLHIEKKETNTEWLVKQLTRFVGVKPVDIGYAGKKDRHAHTRQWLSVHMSGVVEPDWMAFNTDQYQILAVHRHRKKLRPGYLQGNRFEIIVRDLAIDEPLLEARLQQIKHFGVPNYFGEQRFGRNNLESATRWLTRGGPRIKKSQQSIYLSVLRSYLFNCLLDHRVRKGNWNQILNGDVMMLAGTHSCFVADAQDASLQQRLKEHDITPTGPLWGVGDPLVQGKVKELEAEVLESYQHWQSFLEGKKVKQQRRSLMLLLGDMDWQYNNEGSKLQLCFTLPSGSFATSVLRELLDYVDCQKKN